MSSESIGELRTGPVRGLNAEEPLERDLTFEAPTIDLGTESAEPDHDEHADD